MKRLNADIRALESALYKALEIFESVSVDIASHVFNGVVYNLVEEISVPTVVRSKRVAVKSRSSRDVLFDFAVEHTLSPAHDNCRANFSATFQKTHYWHLIFSTRAVDSLRSLTEVHVTSLAADKGFVNFHFAAQLLKRTHPQCKPNAMIHEPCGFLSYADSPVNFVGAYTVLAIHNLPHCTEPLVQAERGILEDRPGLYGKLAFIVMATALPAIVLF